MPFLKCFFVLTLCLSAHLCFGSTTVLLGKNFCSAKPKVCVKGSVDFDYSKGWLSFHGRVAQTRAVGELRIRLLGKTAKKKRAAKTLIVDIEGKSFDLVKAKVRAQRWPRDTAWRLESVTFKARKP